MSRARYTVNTPCIQNGHPLGMLSGITATLQVTDCAAVLHWGMDFEDDDLVVAVRIEDAGNDILRAIARARYGVVMGSERPARALVSEIAFEGDQSEAGTDRGISLPVGG